MSSIFLLLLYASTWRGVTCRCDVLRKWRLMYLSVWVGMFVKSSQECGVVFAENDDFSLLTIDYMFL